MAGVTGRDVKMAFAKTGLNSWGIAASVTKGVYFASTAGMALAPQRVNDEAFGQGFLGRGDLGDVTAPDLTFLGRSRYDDHTYILDALAMGSPAAVTVSNSAVGQTPSFQHIIDLATNADGLAVTIATDKTTYVDELTSAKVYGMSEKVGTGGVMDKGYKVLGSKPTNISSVNITATVAGANFPSLANRVFRKQGTFRLNLNSGSSLSSGDVQQVESVEFEMDRPQDAPHVFGQDYVIAPADNGFPTFKITVKWPRMLATNASSLYAFLRNDTLLKADVTYLGTYINSTDQYKRLYQFPALEIDSWNGADVTGAQQVKPEATFMAKLAATSPSGMPFINPVRLTLTSTTSIVAF